MHRKVLWGAVNLVVSIGVILVTLWVVLHRQEVVDWWRLRSYQPSAQIAQLADSTTMTGQGRDLFYASDPQVEDRDTFNSHCRNTGEESIVLGCYVGQRIYLYSVSDARLSGVKEVTAAHEMLHAAYERMGKNEKEQLNAKLKPQIESIKDARLLALIKIYEKQEPGELYNEMHSILGTESKDLSANLEEYYRAYFTDRHKVVAYSENYERVFHESKDRIATYDSQLQTLRAQIDTNNAALSTQQKALAQESARLNDLRAQNPEQYNTAVPAYNTSVRQFNSMVAETRSLVSQYNTIVTTRNKEAAAQNDLYQSLDSRYQTVQQN